MLVALLVAAGVCAVGSLAVGGVCVSLSHGHRRRTHRDRPRRRGHPPRRRRPGRPTALRRARGVGGPAGRVLQAIRPAGPRQRDHAWPTASWSPRARAAGRTGASPARSSRRPPSTGPGPATTASAGPPSATSTSACAMRTPSTWRCSASPASSASSSCSRPLGAVVICRRRRASPPAAVPTRARSRYHLPRQRPVALHLAGDWAWQMPAVVLPAVALGAAALAASAVERRCGPTGPRFLLVAAGLAVVAILVLGPDRRRLAPRHASPSRPRRGDLHGALRMTVTRAASDMAPQNPEALPAGGESARRPAAAAACRTPPSRGPCRPPRGSGPFPPTGPRPSCAAAMPRPPGP